MNLSRLQTLAVGVLLLAAQPAASGEPAQIVAAGSPAPSTPLAVAAVVDASEAWLDPGVSSPPGDRRPGRTVASADGPEGEGEETESVGDMFLRCCWARGRAAFNFCHAYAACAGVGETVCRGVGAAEGLSVSCANPPARLEELEGG